MKIPFACAFVVFLASYDNVNHAPYLLSSFFSKKKLENRMSPSSSQSPSPNKSINNIIKKTGGIEGPQADVKSDLRLMRFYGP